MTQNKSATSPLCPANYPKQSSFTTTVANVSIQITDFSRTRINASFSTILINSYFINSNTKNCTFHVVSNYVAIFKDATPMWNEELH
jgi:dimeric dUTPase (all-alpha-NTP-PPase superfamily)